uniref:Uncharacterized protein n=1 Tax=Anguilla anguilla TaxID=7936 RepID=A0A0E9WS19_ANGAN
MGNCTKCDVIFFVAHSCVYFDIKILFTGMDTVKETKADMAFRTLVLTFSQQETVRRSTHTSHHGDYRKKNK